MISHKKNTILGICENELDYFLNFKNVTGLGLGTKYIKSQNTGEICLNVFVEKKEDLINLKKTDIIPSKYRGIKTDVFEIGKVSGDALNTRIRPALCGYSIGPINRDITGTSGCIVQRGSGNNISYFILSANHILSHNQTLPMGTKIIQPSKPDGGTSSNVIATLSSYIPLRSGLGEMNLVDCAIARISNNARVSSEIAWLGYPKGVAKAVLGETVKKIGRSTGRTLAKVRGISSFLYVNFGGKYYLFRDQIIIDRFTLEGDSGSLVLNSENKAVGLHIASSNQVSVANNINNVLSALNVELTT